MERWLDLMILTWWGVGTASRLCVSHMSQGFTLWWFNDISNTTHPNSSNWLTMTHTQPWAQYPTPHQVKSSDKSSFHFYLNFPWWVTVFRLLLISFWFIIWFVMLFWKVTFWIFLWLIENNRLLISEMLLSCSGFPHVYKELSCLRERTI